MSCTLEKTQGYELKWSPSVFSTQIGSPSKGELTDRTNGISEIFLAWKKILTDKNSAWQYYYRDVKKRDKIIFKLREKVWESRKLWKMGKVFGAWKNLEKKKGKYLFMRKFVDVWKGLKAKKEKIYIGISKVQEKTLEKVQKTLFGAWKLAFSRIKKLKKLQKIAEKILLKKSFFSIYKTTQKSKFTQKLQLEKLEFLTKPNQKYLKSKFFLSWRLFQSCESNSKLQKVQQNYEEKLTQLMKQLLLQSQELAKERQQSLDRDLEMKDLLNTHATQLYSHLCTNFNNK